MKKFKCLLVTALGFTSSLGFAQDALPRDDAAVELNFAYSQQEYGTIAMEIFAPRMGEWGRLGVNFGFASYVSSPANEIEDRLMRIDQKALAWRLDEPLLRVVRASTPGLDTMGLASTLRVGTQSYENWLDEKVQREDHSFLEMDALLQIRSSLEPGSGSWIKTSTVGLGTGFRLNFIDKATFIGSKEVDRLHVFPTFQFSALLF